MNWLCRLALMLTAGWSSVARAEVALGSLFCDGMVLQRDQPVPIWGWAEPAEAIRISFRDREIETHAGADGRWRATLAPVPASSSPASLVVIGTDREIRIDDVLVGDVWLCAGQSNMAFQVRSSLNAEQEIAAADFPLIRQFFIERRAAADPADRLEGDWKVCDPATAGSFTAVGFYFAREMFRHEPVPIGLINATWGNTPIESWMSPPAIAGLAIEPLKRPASDNPAVAKTRPSSLYNAMIHPLQPAALRGILWYQGEANAARPAGYGRLLTGLIRDWRGAFGAELPFYYVQLSTFGRDTDRTGHAHTWPLLRMEQEAALALPRTGMAVTIDLGQMNNVHYRNKQEVGRRLALIARAQLAGDSAEYSGPRLDRIERYGATLRIFFTHADGLNAGGHDLVGFEIAGTDGAFVPAEASIEGEALLVSAPAVPAPVSVRYAWNNHPEACLFNAAGLPAAPFCSRFAKSRPSSRSTRSISPAYAAMRWLSTSR